MYQTVKKLIVVTLFITFCVVNVLTPAVQATVIDTQIILTAQSNSPESDLKAFLNRGDVHDQLVALGVDPDDASGRVAGLTDQELKQLQSHIHDLPAGSSALALLGAVFLVLIVLELVGVTNIFSKL